MVRILAIDDDPCALEYLGRVLGEEHELVACAGGEAGLAALRGQEFDLVLVDLCMPGVNGFAVLRAIQELVPAPPAIVLTATDTAREAIEALRSGARDYLVKPAPPEAIRAAVERATAAAAPGAEALQSYGLQGRSPAIRQVHRLVPLLAGSREPVLVMGETGTGKELLAVALHAHGPRRDGPFVAHNMAATPTDLAESLFFGHVRGAFSGASADHSGVFEKAHGGTLFLDEVDSFPLGMQAKLLRVLESGRVQRLGASCERPVDVRVVASAPVELEGMVERGLFRADLYYRLRGLELVLPPLRERAEDIPLLARQFLDEMGRETGLESRLGAAVLDCLVQYPWPGNVRELRNALRSAALLAGSSDIQLCHLPSCVTKRSGTDGPGTGPTGLADVERSHIQRVLERVQGNRSLAARLLGIDRGTLARKLRQYDGASSPTDTRPG